MESKARKLRELPYENTIWRYNPELGSYQYLAGASWYQMVYGARGNQIQDWSPALLRVLADLKENSYVRTEVRPRVASYYNGAWFMRIDAGKVQVSYQHPTYWIEEPVATKLLKHYPNSFLAALADLSKNPTEEVEVE